MKVDGRQVVVTLVTALLVASAFSAGVAAQQVEDGATIEGEVVDVTAQDVSNATVTLERVFANGSQTSLAQTTTGADGGFTFENLETGLDYRLNATATINGSTYSGYTQGQLEDLQPGTTVSDIVVEEQSTGDATIEGDVVDANNQAVAGANVTLEQIEDDGSLTVVAGTTTGADGGFSFENVQTGLDYRVSAEVTVNGETYIGATQAQLQDLQAGTTTASVLLNGLELDQDGTIEGEVVDTTAQDISGANVTLERIFANGSQKSLAQETTDADGRFIFEDLETGLDYRLSAEATINGSTYSGSTQGQLEDLPPGTTVADIVVTEENAPTGNIEGDVVDTTAQDVSGATVTLERVFANGSQTTLAQETTGADGGFTFENLETGLDYRLSAEATISGSTYSGSTQAQLQDLQVGTTVVDIVVTEENAPTGNIEGDVVDTTAQDVSGANVTLERIFANGSQTTLAQETTGADGGFTFENLETGLDYRVSAEATINGSTYSGSTQAQLQDLQVGTTTASVVIEEQTQSALPTSDPDFQDVLGVIDAFNDEEPYNGVEVTFQDVLTVVEAFNDGS